MIEGRCCSGCPHSVLPLNSKAHSQIIFGGLARRSLGLVLLLATVLLWTASSFLASTIFADNSYSKPYFVTYVNVSSFSLVLIVVYFRCRCDTRKQLLPRITVSTHAQIIRREEDGALLGSTSDHRVTNLNSLEEEHLCADEQTFNDSPRSVDLSTRLDYYATAWLSLEFAMLWFAANYFVAACLEYTTVASSTILTASSSMWTLFFGALMSIERFSPRKLVGVLVSLIGIGLISAVDISGDSDENRGSFPHKTVGQIVTGDLMALLSALLYGLYSILMKKRIGDESRVEMPIFLGFVGVFTLVLLWPGFLLLHYTNIEPFLLPPTSRIWTIISINALISLLSDFCWAYAMLLTSPLVVTVGLSLSIPLSLVGQILINSQRSSLLYWIGATVVILAFLFINHETEDAEPESRCRGGIMHTEERDGWRSSIRHE